MKSPSHTKLFIFIIFNSKLDEEIIIIIIIRIIMSHLGYDKYETIETTQIKH